MKREKVSRIAAGGQPGKPPSKSVFGGVRKRGGWEPGGENQSAKWGGGKKQQVKLRCRGKKNGESL